MYSNLSDAETIHNQMDIFNDDDSSESDATIYNEERDSEAGAAHCCKNSCLYGKPSYPSQQKNQIPIRSLGNALGYLSATNLVQLDTQLRNQDIKKRE